MIKRLVFLFISLSPFTFLYPQSYYLNVNLNNGTKETFDVTEIVKIDFDGISELNDIEKISNFVKSFSLRQNYPNPFNPLTTIEYSLPKPGEIRIKIFSITGQLVKIIQKNHQKSGVYKVVWNGRNNFGNKVASGFYLYQARFERNVISKKMLIIK